MQTRRFVQGKCITPNGGRVKEYVLTRWDPVAYLVYTRSQSVVPHLRESTSESETAEWNGMETFL